MQNNIELDVHRYVDSTFKNGILKFVVLNAVCRQRVHPYELYKKLREVNFGVLSNVKKSEVYNTLNSLETKGFVKAEHRLFGTKIRKEYSITHKGMKIATKARKIMMSNIRSMKRLMMYEFE